MRAKYRALGDGNWLLEYDVLNSTQDEARAHVRVGKREIVGVRANYQGAGRGRGGAKWIAPPNACLLVTYILHGEDCRPENAGRLAFVAAVAVAEAIEAQAGLSPTVKWPNDVLLSGRKAAGILIETVTSFLKPKKYPSDAVALVGIGLNVNVERFPEELDRTATSLRLETGRKLDIVVMEEAVRRALFAARGLAWEELLRRWRARDVTPGLRYHAMMDGRELEGTALGISDSGALILQVEKGRTQEVFTATSAAQEKTA